MQMNKIEENELAEISLNNSNLLLLLLLLMLMLNTPQNMSLKI